MSAPQDAEYVRLLEHVVAQVSANEDGLLDCWSPVEGMVNLAGHVEERPCFSCAPCRVLVTIDALESWQNERDYWPQSDGTDDAG